MQNEIKQNGIETEVFKDTYMQSTPTANYYAETRITGAVVFRGSLNLWNQILFLIDNHSLEGELIYRTVTSPHNKLWITENEPDSIKNNSKV